MSTQPEPCWQEMLGELREIRVQVAVLAERQMIVADHETRLRSLERLVWPLAAIPTILAGLAIIKDWAL